MATFMSASPFYDQQDIPRRSLFHWMSIPSRRWCLLVLGDIVLVAICMFCASVETKMPGYEPVPARAWIHFQYPIRDALFALMGKHR
jgi:hypothetical protein